MMKNIKPILFILFFRTIELIYGQGEFKQAPFMFQLENGLNVVVVRDNTVNNITAELYFRAGSRYEQINQHGFAHLMEHSLRPVRIFEKPSNWNEYKKIFIYSNAQTRSDYTRYHQQIKSNGVENVLAALSDRANMPVDSLNDERINKNIKIVVNEISSPDNKIWYYDDSIYKTIRKNVFGNMHPYAHIQEVNDIEKATSLDIQQWFKAYHNANQTYLLLSGNVDTTNLKTLVNKYFGNLKPAPKLKLVKKQVPIIPFSKTEQINFQGEYGSLVYYWSIPEWGSYDGEILNFINEFIKSKISNNLKERNLEGEIYGSSNLYELAGIFSLGVQFKNIEPIKRYESILDSVLNEIAENGIKIEELSDYKNRFLFNQDISSEDYGFYSVKNRQIIEGAIFMDNPNFFDATLKRIRNTTPEEIKSSIQKWLLNKNKFTLIVDNSLLSTTQEIIEIDHSKMPTIDSVQKINFPVVKSVKTANNIEIQFLESKKSEISNITFIFKPESFHNNPYLFDNLVRELKSKFENELAQINYQIIKGIPIISIATPFESSLNIIDGFLHSIKHLSKKNNSKTSDSSLYQNTYPLLSGLIKTDSNKVNIVLGLEKIIVNGISDSSKINQILKNLDDTSGSRNGIDSKIDFNIQKYFGIDETNKSKSEILGYMLFKSYVNNNIVSVLLLEKLLSNNLNHILREEFQWTYDVQVGSIMIDKNTYLIQISTNINSDKLNEAKKFMKERIVDANFNFSVDDLEMAKTYLKSNILEMLDTKSRQNQILALISDQMELKEIFSEIDKFKLDDIKNELVLYCGYYFTNFSTK